MCVDLGWCNIWIHSYVLGMSHAHVCSTQGKAWCKYYHELKNIWRLRGLGGKGLGFKVKFGSLLPLVPSFHMGLLFTVNPPYATLLLLLLLFPSYFYYFSFIFIFLSLLLLLFFLLLLLFSHYYFSLFIAIIVLVITITLFPIALFIFHVAITLLTWCCSFPLMKEFNY